jgi:hypothetical protein
MSRKGKTWVLYSVQAVYRPVWSTTREGFRPAVRAGKVAQSGDGVDRRVIVKAVIAGVPAAVQLTAEMLRLAGLTGDGLVVLEDVPSDVAEAVEAGAGERLTWRRFKARAGLGVA